MSTILFIVVLVALFAGSIKLTKHSNALRFFLFGLYVAIIAVVINLYNAGIAADEKGMSFVDVSWFGLWWPVVLSVLLLAIITTHVAIYIRREKN